MNLNKGDLLCSGFIYFVMGSVGNVIFPEIVTNVPLMTAGITMFGIGLAIEKQNKT